MRLPLPWCLVATLLLAHCGELPLRSREGTVEFEDGEDALTFEPTWVGATRTRTLRLLNTSSSPQTVTLRVGPPFLLGTESPRTLEGHSISDWAIAFTPSAVGDVGSALVLDAGGRQTRRSVAGKGLAIPPCPQLPCRTSRFEPALGACLETHQPDQSSCADACAPSAACIDGNCHGELRSCDDGDPCTLDACSPEVGCLHEPARCAGPVGACQVATCDPTQGWRMENVLDGTPCGRQDCDVADVCIAGACVERVPPDGARCGGDSPCQAAGTCHAGACEREPPRALDPVWTYPPAGERDWWQLDGLLADSSGNLYFIHSEGSFPSPTRMLVSLTPGGQVRFRRAVDAVPTLGPIQNGLLFSTAAGGVTAFRAHDGTVAWQNDLGPVVTPLAHVSSCMQEDAANGELSIGPCLLRPAGPGQFVCIVNLYRKPSSCNAGAVLVLLRASDGQLLSAHRVAESAWSEGIADSAGTFYTFLRDVTPTGERQYGLAAMGADGTRRWWRSGVMGAEAVLDGRVLAQDEWPLRFRALSVDSGADLGPLPADEGMVFAGRPDGFVWNGDSILAVVPFIHGGEGGGSNTSLVNLDLRDGMALWVQALRPGDFSHVTPPVLTSRETVLLAEFDWPRRGLLREFDARGNERFQCALPEGLSSVNHVVLHEGLWVLADGLGVWAFRVPGRDLAPSGWATVGADNQRTYLARPAAAGCGDF